jgi:transaldolase/glucose-6-phosphate isomerase
VDLPIPGEPHSFGVMIAAQAPGDLHSLHSRKRRALRIHITGDIEAGLKRVLEAMREIT